ncbi:MAG: hypothetical protein ACREI9_04640 [Nitrospiraceae bacterium]
MRGKIEVQFDIAKGGVTGIDFKGMDIRQGVQILLMAVQASIAQWIEIESGIIRPRGGGGNHDQQKAGGEKKDDDNDGGGAAA